METQHSTYTIQIPIERTAESKADTKGKSDLLLWFSKVLGIIITALNIF